jgi:hypothetical protein
MTERRCINCNDLMAEGDATVLYADAKPIAWVHPTCLEDYAVGGHEPAATTAEEHDAFKRWIGASGPQRKARLTKHEGSE